MNQRQQQQQQHLLEKYHEREILFLLFSPFFAFFAKVVGTPNKQLSLAFVFLVRVVFALSCFF